MHPNSPDCFPTFYRINNQYLDGVWMQLNDYVAQFPAYKYALEFFFVYDNLSLVGVWMQLNDKMVVFIVARFPA